MASLLGFTQPNMKIKHLAELFDRLRPSVSTSARHHALSYVRLLSDGATLTATATDLTSFTQVSVPTDCEPFETVAPYEVIRKFLTVCPKEADILLSAEWDRIVLSSPQFTYEFRTITTAEFPVMPSLIQSRGILSIGYQSLLNGLTVASKTVSRDVIDRSYLQGIHLKVNSGTLTLESSDGRQLTQYKTEVEGDDCDLILPPSVVNLLKKNAAADEVEIEIFDDAACFTVGDSRFIVRLIKETYPDLDAIVAREKRNRWTVAIDRKQLLKALEVGGKGGRKESTTIDLYASKENQTLTIVRPMAEGKTETAISSQVQVYSRTSLDRDYLINALKALKSIEVLISLSPLGVNTIEPLGGDRVLYGVMAVRRKEWVYDAIKPFKRPVKRVVWEDAIVPFIRPVKITLVHPEVGTLEPESREAFTQLLWQLSEVEYMAEYVIDIEDMKQAVIISLRPDEAFELACGSNQAIVVGGSDTELKELEGKYCAIHAAEVDEEVLSECHSSLEELQISPEDAPAGHILGYCQIFEVQKYATEKDWNDARNKGYHVYTCALKQYQELLGTTEPLYGVIVSSPVMLMEYVPLVGEISAGFWSPGSPMETAVLRQAFDKENVGVEVDRELRLPGSLNG